ncbi:hypothetical protein [Sulfitobacter sp. R18_1]|uniref:hypothetical protein n=1 Tax=Sulfitobacter sp. R18_1 TaxID=2821104 RepID=UPI001ADCC60A|nr:hypothetical protein [Sulfitobacter sp. R18_1]MBO9428498.1 hypothetical protein [Sulfitobacter sp. R18_1]
MSGDLTKKLDDLKSRHRALENKKIQADTQVEHLSSIKQDLMTEMKEKFGVSSVEELRELHEKLRKEDEKTVEDFGQSIAAVEQKLSSLQEG